MGFLSPFVRGQTWVWALPRLWRREADTTSYVADYLTRSVRRASGFVLVGHSEVRIVLVGDGIAERIGSAHEPSKFVVGVRNQRLARQTKVCTGCVASRNADPALCLRRESRG